MTTTPQPPDALDLAREVDRLFEEWERTRAIARRDGSPQLAAAALRAFESYRLAIQRADRAAATFALGTEGVG